MEGISSWSLQSSQDVSASEGLSIPVDEAAAAALPRYRSSQLQHTVSISVRLEHTRAHLMQGYIQFLPSGWSRLKFADENQPRTHSIQIQERIHRKIPQFTLQIHTHGDFCLE